ncbi:MAG: hypothetical protein ACLRVT_07145 [Oscillospiraceae bacterium]
MSPIMEFTASMGLAVWWSAWGDFYYYYCRPVHWAAQLGRKLFVKAVGHAAYSQCPS